MTLQEETADATIPETESGPATDLVAAAGPTAWTVGGTEEMGDIIVITETGTEIIGQTAETGLEIGIEIIVATTIVTEDVNV
jgi:hypothetical protein